MIKSRSLRSIPFVLASLMLLAACETQGPGSGDGKEYPNDNDNIQWVDECRSDAIEIGTAGEFNVEKLNFDWDFHDNDLWQNEVPFQIRIPNDLVGLVVSLNDHGRQPGVYDARLDGNLVSAVYESPQERPLSKSIPLWNDAISFAVPSNAKTAVADRGCLELDLVSLGSAAGDSSAELYFTSLRRPGRTLGNQIDIQARILDDAIDPAEIRNVEAYLQSVFENACPSAGHCIKPVFVDHFVSLSSAAGDGVLDASDNSDDAERKEIAALQCENISGIDCEDAARGINIVFVKGLYLDELDDDLILAGLAGGIPMVPFDGTAGSSLYVSMDAHRTLNGGDISVPLLAETIAHELGHSLGLFHTTEQQGTEFDAIADTPECDADIYGTGIGGRVDSSICKTIDGNNLMFWESTIGPAKLSEEQTMVLRSHPLVYDVK